MDFSFTLIHFDDFDLPPWPVFPQLSWISSFVYSQTPFFVLEIFIQVFARAKDLEIMDMPEVRQNWSRFVGWKFRGSKLRFDAGRPIENS